MSKRINSVVPYLWILSLSMMAVYHVNTFFALLPATLAGMWIGVLLADKAWSKDR